MILKIWKQVKQAKEKKMRKWILMVGSRFFFSISIFCHFNDLDDNDENDNDEDEIAKLEAKKANKKSAFDAEYDQSKDPDSAYLDELKKEVEIQTKVLLLINLFISTMIIIISFFLVKSI